MKIKNRGFTLFELIVIIGILLLFIGLSLVYYNNYSEGISLQGETKNLSNALALASKKAQVAELAEQCTTFLGYRVEITSESSYELQRCCGSDLLNPQLTVNKVYNLPINIKIVSSIPSTVLYKKLSGGVVINENEENTSLKITLQNNALKSKNCINININKVGIVETGERQNCEQ